MMYKYQRFEYNRTSKPLFIYFLLDIFSYALVIIMFTLQRLNKDTLLILTGLYMINFPQIIVGFAIVRLKDNKDFIQELSKLDYLVIVSIF